MKRQFSTLPVYKAVFKEYVLTLMEEGNYLEFFIEGTRSRNGKTHHPKFGILNMVLDAYMQKRVKNVIFVPVYFSYELMLESPSHVREMLGETKKKETTVNMLKGLTESLTCNFGDIVMQVGEPISLSKYLNDPLHENLRNNRRDLSSKLGFEITNSLNDNYVALSSHIVSSILLQHLGDVRLSDRRSKISIESLCDNVLWLKNELISKGVGVYTNELESSPIAMIERTLSIFSGYIEKKGDNIVVKSSRDFLMLSIYKNSLAPVFTKESILLCALHSFRAKDIDFSTVDNIEIQKVDLEELKERCAVLGELLNLEIHPSDMLDTTEKFMECVQDLERREKIACQTDQNKTSITILDIQYHEFVCSLIWPALDTYSAVVGYCCMAVNRTTMHSFVFETFVMEVKYFLEKLFQETSVSYFESVSVLTIKNAITRFIIWNILHKLSINNVNTIQIQEYYANQPKELEEWWLMISLYTKYKQKVNFLSLNESVIPTQRVSKL